jgi:hypothetical protein
MITLYPGAPTVDGSALVIYAGTADRSVEWSLSGSGTLTAISSYTDHNGQAAARYTPGTEGDPATITVSAGAGLPATNALQRLRPRVCPWTR